jgi:two-component system NtrC family sensor kinase
MEMIVYTKILSKAGETVGYLEEIISIDQVYLESLQKRLNLEIFLLDKDGKIKVSTSDDFKMYPNQFFAEKMADRKLLFFEIINQGTPYVVKVQPLREEDPSIMLGLAASKKDVTNALKGINKALFTVVGVVLLLLVIVLIATSRTILKPLNHLVEAAHKIEEGKFGAQIPIESDTEIGLLTDSFNQMSQKVAEARKELEKKITELEKTNRDLQEAQSQLVHSSKMVSLGQLVAGIAHELNNPIGFIYSNMTHLREYGEKLEKVATAAEKGPLELAKAKQENDYDYIIEDMPRLIASCEDGAKRVRDIVVGLRNFSRLDEGKIKEIDINESIENTLSLLQGELKNRIHVNRIFGTLPKYKCYASQLNQVFMNILSNGAQAIQGNGELTIKTSVEEHQLKISIADSGEGMTEEILEKIFDPFFTTKAVGEGTGLGLSISYGIIQRHGGEIQVKSKKGQGTEFLILLPLEAPLAIASV